MTYIKKISFQFLLLAALSACITPLDVNTVEGENTLVVEGYVTTELGPHEIIISRSAKYGDIFEGNPRKEENALVSIRDGKGKISILNEGRAGYYYTSTDFRAEVGNSYTLLIETRNGERFTSFPQTVNKAPEIENLIYEYELIQGAAGEFDYESNINVFVQFTDDLVSDDYYNFQINGIYRALTRPDLYTISVDGVRIPAPKDCCAECYIYEDFRNADPLTDDRFRGKTVIQPAGVITDNGLRYLSAYQVEVKLLAINKDAYAFYSLYNSQQEIDGDIFDPPPAVLRSNMINITFPDKQTIGYFGAYDVSSYKKFIDLSIIEKFAPQREVRDDCRILDNSTIVPPADWEE